MRQSFGARTPTSPNWWGSAEPHAGGCQYTAVTDLRWTYPYQEEARTGLNHLGVPLLRPTVAVRAGVDTHVYAALVDSGADNVLAPEWLARAAGVIPDAARELQVRIGGSARTIRFQELELELLPPDALRQGDWEGGGVRWEATVGFFMNWADPPWLVILGQCGFFDKFTVTLSRFAQSVAIERQECFDTRFGIDYPS